MYIRKPWTTTNDPQSLTQIPKAPLDPQHKPLTSFILEHLQVLISTIIPQIPR